jgi:hypothetical protein
MMLFTFAPCMQHPCVIIPPGRSTDPDIIRVSFWGLPLYHSSPLQNHRTVTFASTVAQLLGQVYWIATGVLIVKEQTPRVVISLGYYEGTYCIYKRHAVFHAAQSSIPLRRKVGSRSAASDPAELIGRKAKMTINPEAFRLRDLMAPFVGVPTPGHPLLQAAGRTRLNGLASQHPGLTSLARWPMTFPDPDRSHAAAFSQCLVTGDW